MYDLELHCKKELSLFHSITYAIIYLPKWYHHYIKCVRTCLVFVGKENSLFTWHLTTRRYYYYCWLYGGLDLTKCLSMSLFMFLLVHSPCFKISSLRSSFCVHLFLLFEMSLLRLHFKIPLYVTQFWVNSVSVCTLRIIPLFLVSKVALQEKS